MSDAQEIKKNQRGGFRPGAGRPKGTPQPEGQKIASRVHLIKKRLVDHSLGKCEMSGTEIKAAEVVLDRHEPRLASIEQTITDPRDTKDPAQIEAQLRAMYDAHPELFAFIQAKAPQQSSESPVEPHTTH